DDARSAHQYWSFARGKGLGDRGRLAGAFVLGEDVDATLVTLGLGPGLVEERVDDREGLLTGVHAAADAHQLGVVVLAGQPGGLDAPGEGAARAGDLVGGDLLAVAGATQDDAEAAGVGDELAGRGDAESRVVVLRVVGVGATVDHLVPGGLQVLGDGV